MSDAPAGMQVGRSPSLTVVMPVWNEIDMLPLSVPATCSELDAMVADSLLSRWELVLVDDASTDGSGRLIERMAIEEQRIIVRHHDRNRKLGAAVRTGFAAATGDLVLYTDADLPFDPRQIRTAVRLAELHAADLVAAYRLSRMGEGAVRLVYSYVYNFLVRTLLGLRVRDVNFAAKLMRRELVDSLRLRSEGSFIDAEILSLATNRGARIVQFGVDYFPRTRGASTLSSPPVIATLLREFASLGPGIRRGSRSARSARD